MLLFIRNFFVLILLFSASACGMQEGATIVFGDEEQGEYDVVTGKISSDVKPSQNDLIIEDATPVTEDYNINPNKDYSANEPIIEDSVSEIATTNKVDRNQAESQPQEIIAIDNTTSSEEKNYGQTIKISSITHEVQAGETLYSLSRKYNIPILPIIISNNLEQPYTLKSGQKIKIPEGTFHIVGDADTLYSISRKYNVDMSALTQVNALSEPFKISKGQKLQIPFPSSSIATTEISNTEATTTETISPPKRVINYEQNIEADGLLRAENQMEGGPASLQKSHKSVFAFKKDGDNETALAKDALENNFAQNSSKINQAKLPVNPTKPSIPEVEKPVENKIAFSQETKPTAPKIIEDKNISKQGFIWPIRGKIVKNFGTQKNNEYSDGINIAANAGAEVKASSAGRVVYTGDSLKSYGNLVIVKHDNGLLTAYAHLNKINVKNDQKVARGQVIGNVGATGKVNSPQLYFAVRKGKDAKDPNTYLP
ncbi:MAG: LysM peptidoglycan-binding domain-containing M23 family metallopeptidase [Rickettsiales bacterium]|nr:LysM peptidoglycan-binding domain-containing M23 family metallopeptidase [Rickettsiales bacterium]